MKSPRYVLEALMLLEDYGVKVISQFDCLSCGAGEFESCKYFKRIQGLPCCLMGVRMCREEFQSQASS